MKHKIAIAGMFAATALLTTAQASTVLFNSTLANNTYTQGYTDTLPSGGGTVKIYGFDGVFTAATPPPTVAVNSNNPDAPVSTSGPGTVVTSVGLGDHNVGNSYIAPGDAVVLDFSGVSSTIKPTASNLQFNMTVDATGPSYWVIYGYNSTNHDYVLLSQGPMESGGGLTGTFAAFPQATVSAQYSEYLVGITNDCDLTVNSVVDTTVTNQQTPEPGTFVMAGMALVVIGLTMKKRASKA